MNRGTINAPHAKNKNKIKTTDTVLNLGASSLEMLKIRRIGQPEQKLSHGNHFVYRQKTPIT